jgi:hypothetical protein
MRFKLSTLVLAGTLGVSGAALAAAPSLHFAGEIAKLDVTGKTLVVKTEHSPMKQLRFTLASDAKIMEGSQTKALADLKKGDHVTVAYTTAGTRNEAHRIDLAGAKGNGGMMPGSDTTPKPSD